MTTNVCDISRRLSDFLIFVNFPKMAFLHVLSRVHTRGAFSCLSQFGDLFPRVSISGNVFLPH